MFTNKLKRQWAEGRPAINGWLSIGNPFTAEIMAAQGYDSVTIDIQHGALDYGSVLPMFQAMRASGVTPMARVPWREPGIIMKALDAGAQGIICPMVNSAEEAAEFVSYMRYPPLGQRSFGPTRATFAYGSYGVAANDELLALAMIETQLGVDNLEAIAATPGLDGIYIGPADLTLGTQNGTLPPAFDREEEVMITLIRRILSVCKENGIRACLHCGTAEYAAKAIGWGFDLTTVGGDSRFLAAAASASVRTWRDLTGTAPADAPAQPAKGGY
ncbi:2,4-dihydroxyhept-2-ene-1,7-dioic acid aldolase [Sinirhodobacter populi]|uniref:2,4-dihydroxyhept-2-ene-1,7-dioic acid aldolase n=1 Tax=Paenirhodobacter populi TaxID=2306993 RepID=A0A443KE26_9RHOB|nr:aldolase/citrate lyase family protein [Sinirhodobacter populi]RWR31040.1 2,4-dihydroxyhept-2-ene-1,7-dioic acid aldolase [Sinirhodobacter populi]